MNRVISFSYTLSKPCGHYLEFFKKFMLDNSFRLKVDEEKSEQLITLDGLKRAIRRLQSTVSSNDSFDFETLDQNCIDTLTRTVQYRRLVFKSTDLSSTVDIRLSSKNDFPVIGFELWVNGLSSLPAGMLSICTESELLCNSISKAVLDYKSE